MAGIPRPMNPFIGGLPMGDMSPLFNPVPMQQQRPPMPMPPQQLPPQLMQAAPMGPPQTFGAPAQIPQLGAAASMMAAPQEGQDFRQTLGNALGSNEMLAFAGGLLGGGSSAEALGRGFTHAAAVRNNGGTGSTTALLQNYAAYRQEAMTRGEEPMSLLEFNKELNAREAGGEYGLNPIYIQTPDGIKAVLPGKDGSYKELDFGDNSVLDPGEKAASVAAGKKRGEAVINLPTVENAANRLISVIDNTLSDESLGSVTGPWQGGLPTMTGGQARAQSKIDQINGATFLQAFNDLKGGGQITEQEGKAATAAYNRLRTQRMYDQDYRAALEEFRNEVMILVEIARQRAGAPPMESGGVPSGASNGGWSIEEVR